LGLKWKYPGLFDVGENVDLDVVIETTNLLNMWSCIESSYDHLSDGDKHAYQKFLSSMDSAIIRITLLSQVF